MKKIHPIFILCLVAISLSIMISCGDDEETDLCEGVNVPAGFMCVDGDVVEDPDAFCDRNTCPAGFICDEASDQCVQSDLCLNVNCGEGFECDPATGNCERISAEVSVVSGFISSDQTWTSDKIYELANKVVVQEGITLTIEAGTIIKGREGTGSLATALVISRGAQIIADGTADNPIIFTSVLDDIEPGELTGTNLTEFDNEKWGGLIILGRAPISAGEGDTESLIEGIPPDDGFGFYGGDDPADNSGILRYVSVRHGGAEIGEGNEINGITLGGVGTGTVIENVEVVANLDDGIECFGGTVDISNALVYFVGDDALDLDQNYSGTIDNYAVFQGDGVGTDEALEIDGPEGTLSDGLFTLQNGTIMSVDGAGSGGDLKSKAQGTITSTVWMNYSDFFIVRASFNDDDCSGKEDAFSHIGDGTLVITGNEFVTAAGTDLVEVYTESEVCMVSDAMQMTAETHVTDNNSLVDSPSIGADMSVFEGWTWAAANSKL